MSDVKGKLNFPSQWTAFAPCPSTLQPLPVDQFKSIPKKLTLEGSGETRDAIAINTTHHQFDFLPLFGEKTLTQPQEAYVFIPLTSDVAQEVTLGMGADYYMQAWVNSGLVLDTIATGNGKSPPSVQDHRVDVQLNAGQNILVVRLLNGRTNPILALGGPAELRSRELPSIAPKRVQKRQIESLEELYEQFPPESQSPITWHPPKTFDPSIAGLGLPQLQQAELTELLHALPSKAALEDGGNGDYESLSHGTWNHSPMPCVFENKIVTSWNQHSIDEGGPGVRTLARWGTILNDDGQVDWGSEANLFEAAPTAVPVRRRQAVFTDELLYNVTAQGDFVIIEGRLFFAGKLLAKYGMTTNSAYTLSAGLRRNDHNIPHDLFCFTKGPRTIGGGNVMWDLEVSFYQEWAVRDDSIKPISPVYKNRDIPRTLNVTPKLTVPIAPIRPHYTNAMLLDQAPSDFQELIRHGKRKTYNRILKFKPGTSLIAANGINGMALGHGSEFQRPDGKWVCVRENQGPPMNPSYYSSVKAHADDDYPPAYRTNLYGAVKPAAGELPDGRVFIVGNSPRRQDMFLTVSNDGINFDRTWLLYHKRLKDFTPGMMKSQGGPGSGPQYFKSIIVGNSLWIFFSIAKEHIGTMRVPLSAIA